jgi:chitin synthase
MSVYRTNISFDKYQMEGISRFVPWYPTLTMPSAFTFSKTSREPSSTSWMTRLADHTRRWTTRWWKPSENAGVTTNIGAIDHSRYPMFTVNHFNGPMTYSPEGFLDHNLGSLNPVYISLLRGSIVGMADSAEGAGPTNPFVKGLFSGKGIATKHTQE